MDERDWLTQHFEEKRTHLRAVAYRMLGSISEADDAVQEAWLRLQRSDTSGVGNLGGWLTTVVSVGAVWAPGGRARVVFGFTIADGKILAIDLTADSERLDRMDVTVLSG
jgi:hypothetical protein